MRRGRRTILKRIATSLLTVAMAFGIVAVTASPAAAAGEFCNNWTCVESFDEGTYIGRLETSVWTGNRGGTAQTKVWATNGTYGPVWTKRESLGSFRTYRDWVYPQRHFPNGTWICAEGFLDGRSVGLPCFQIQA